MNSAKDLIKHLWENYRTLVPSAKKIENQLRLQNEVWIEDHIALRSFNFGNFGSRNLEKYFEKFGWRTVKSDYKFPKKKICINVTYGFGACILIRIRTSFF